MDDRVVSSVETEVEHRHLLLATWIGSPARHAVLEELRDSLSADFCMVSLDGHVIAREGVLEGLAGAGNSRPGLRILISEVTVVVELADALLVRFLETHIEHRHTASRQVSALLQADDAAPRGLRWRYLHETPIPE